MKNNTHFFSILFLLIPLNLFSQEPAVAWQKTIGGSLQDFSTVSIQTADGGYLLGGYSLSNSGGNKSENCIGNYDYWVVKTSVSGDIEWENTIGGNAEDYLRDVLQTPDGGYMLAGYSRSPVSGDKTLGIIGGVSTTYDFWLIKLLPTGTIQWQKTIGCNGTDVLNSIDLTADGGYILGGYSDSPISADKTENANGSVDYWLVKTDNSGNVQWQNTIGGTSVDKMTEVEQTLDGGYILGGNSFSPSSGDKSENNFGAEDYWVVKVNAAGVVEWENTIGSLDVDFLTCAKQTSSGNYIIAGYSKSEAGFDKTENNHNQFFSDSDIWLVLLDADGNIIIQNTIGSNQYEDNCALSITSDGGFIVGSISGDDIDGDLNETGAGSVDYWILKLDANLNIVWQNLFGGASTESLSSVITTSDNGYLVSGYSFSSATGDKTAPLVGIFDYWIVKLDADNCVPVTYYADVDKDLFGNNLSPVAACEVPPGFILNSDDCDDQKYFINPLRTEICNQLDDNCDGNIDEGLTECTLPPTIINQNTISGLSSDQLAAMRATTDGGYILCGYSNSEIGLDKTEASSSNDIWLVKLNANLDIEWQRSFGTIKDEEVTDLQQTADGGFVICLHIDINNVTFWDYKVIKLDALGSTQWQTSMGGTGSDFSRCIAQSADGGFLIGGISQSGIGGSKTTPAYGSWDWWVVKLNSSGTIEWQKTYGGSSDDQMSVIIPTSDGGFALGGYSSSNISGNKTTNCLGVADYWFIKIDNLGNIQYQKIYGGSSSESIYGMLETADTGFLLTGTSSSPISGNKTEDVIGNTGVNYNDFWVVKINNIGTIEWQKVIGGDYSESDGRLLMAADNNYYCVGRSNSWRIGDPDPDVTDFNVFMVKINQTGTVLWQKEIVALGTDYLASPCLGLDGNIGLGIVSSSDIYGDKLEDSYNTDYWAVLLNENDCIATTEICNTLDDDCNGLIDDGVAESIIINADGPTTFCQGSTVLLSATYSGASIQWKKNGVTIPGATSSTYAVNKSGNYSATTNSPCGNATSTTIAVTVNKNPNASISAAGPTTFCAGGSVILTEVAVAGCTYQWYKGVSPIAGATSLTYNATASGNYKCRVTKAATGCYKNSNTIAVSVTCKEGEMIENEIIVYPNPALDILTISTDNSQIKIINLYDALGRLINSQIASENEVLLNIENLSPGTYFIQIVENQLVSTHNFIKQ